jgi:hypothetical protein
MVFDLFKQKKKSIEKVTVQFLPSDSQVFAEVGQSLSDAAIEGTYQG